MGLSLRLIKDKIKNNLLLFSILISLIFGFSLGVIFKQSENKSVAQWFKLPGILFIRCLELLITPVIFIGVVAATSSLTAKNNFRITLICVFFIFLTHLIAVLTGLLGSLILKSVSKSYNTHSITTSKLEANLFQKNAYDIASDILRNIIPKNIIKATTHQEITKIIVDSNGTLVKKSVQYIEGTNLLGILFFAILIGLATSVLDSKVNVFRQFFQAANEVVIRCLRWIILFSPIGIASLIIEAILEIDNIEDSFKRIGLFALVCSLTLIFYGVCVLSLLMFVFIRRNPFKYYVHFIEAGLLAAASTSGAVCMHKSLEICEQKLHMDTRISRFSISFYTALQADGSAIFIVMATSFLAYYSNATLSTSDYIVILIETAILCICLPSVPSSSIVTILVVLNTININTTNIALLYTVEWLLDRLRTTVNLYSHDFCSVITYELFLKKNRDITNFELNHINTNESKETIINL